MCVLLFNVSKHLIFLRKENWRNALALKKKKAQGKFGKTFMLRLLSKLFFVQKTCIIFLLNYFVSKIKGFYQSSLGNEIEFREIMNVSQISCLKNKVSQTWDMVLSMKVHWQQYLSVTRKPLYLFDCERKDLNYRKTLQKITVNFLFNDVSYYLVIGCFPLKNWRFSTNGCKEFTVSLKKCLLDY